MVNDVADVLEKAAAGPMHTPALYSCFLRALVSAKTEPSTGFPSQTPNGDVEPTSQDHAQAAQLHAPGGNAYVNAFDPLGEFQFDGEMGPVADISTFPPTMAPNPHAEDHLGNMLTMDSILSASFWDSVLVPGELLHRYYVVCDSGTH